MQLVENQLDIRWLEAIVRYGVGAKGGGPTLAEYQPQDAVRVMLDPAGHRFCLFPSQV